MEPPPTGSSDNGASQVAEQASDVPQLEACLGKSAGVFGSESEPAPQVSSSGTAHPLAAEGELQSKEESRADGLFIAPSAVCDAPVAVVEQSVALNPDECSERFANPSSTSEPPTDTAPDAPVPSSPASHSLSGEGKVLNIAEASAAETHEGGDHAIADAMDTTLASANPETGSGCGEARQCNDAGKSPATLDSGDHAGVGSPALMADDDDVSSKIAATPGDPALLAGLTAPVVASAGSGSTHVANADATTDMEPSFSMAAVNGEAAASGVSSLDEPSVAMPPELSANAGTGDSVAAPGLVGAQAEAPSGPGNAAAASAAAGSAPAGHALEPVPEEAVAEGSLPQGATPAAPEHPSEPEPAVPKAAPTRGGLMQWLVGSFTRRVPRAAARGTPSPAEASAKGSASFAAGQPSGLGAGSATAPPAQCPATEGKAAAASRHGGSARSWWGTVLLRRRPQREPMAASLGGDGGVGGETAAETMGGAHAQTAGSVDEVMVSPPCEPAVSREGSIAGGGSDGGPSQCANPPAQEVGSKQREADQLSEVPSTDKRAEIDEDLEHTRDLTNEAVLEEAAASSSAANANIRLRVEAHEGALDGEACGQLMVALASTAALLPGFAESSGDQKPLVQVQKEASHITCIVSFVEAARVRPAVETLSRAVRGDNDVYAVRNALSAAGAIQGAKVEVARDWPLELMRSGLAERYPHYELSLLQLERLAEATDASCELYAAAWREARLRSPHVCGKLCEMPSQARFQGQLHTVEEGRRRGLLEDWTPQGARTLDGMIADAVQAHSQLKGLLAPGTQWGLAELNDRGSVALQDGRRSWRSGPSDLAPCGEHYDPGVEDGEAVRRKALRLRRSSEGEPPVQDVTDVSRLSIIFETADWLQRALSHLLQRLDVLWMLNRFQSPSCLGYRCINMGVRQRVYVHGQPPRAHVSEIELGLREFANADAAGGRQYDKIQSILLDAGIAHDDFEGFLRTVLKLSCASSDSTHCRNSVAVKSRVDTLPAPASHVPVPEGEHPQQLFDALQAEHEALKLRYEALKNEHEDLLKRHTVALKPPELERSDVGRNGPVNQLLRSTWKLGGYRISPAPEDEQPERGATMLQPNTCAGGPERCPTRKPSGEMVKLVQRFKDGLPLGAVALERVMVSCPVQAPAGRVGPQMSAWELSVPCAQCRPGPEREEGKPPSLGDALMRQALHWPSLR